MLRFAIALATMFASASILFGSAACSSASCQAACERAAKADCNQDGAADGDAAQCIGTCTQLQATTTASGCTAQYDAFVSCAASAELCTTGQPCSTELAAWSACIEAFCVTSPASEFCAQA